MAHDTFKRGPAQTTSVAFQYRREQVAKQMAGVYTAFGAAGSQGKTTEQPQQGQTHGSDKRKD
jgi:hypothetical protein